MPAPWRVALVGYGLAGRYFHRPLIQAINDLALTHIVTANPERRGQASRDAPDAALVTNVDNLWRIADTFDAVVIATANDAHVRLAHEAIDRGKAVVVDKPMAITSDEGWELVDKASRAGVLLTPFHNRRWDSDTLTLQRLLADGTLGTVHRFESRFQRFRPNVELRWREADPSLGGGVLFDLGTHLVDPTVVPANAA